MSKRIKGITIEIDGNTTGLDKALSGVNKQSINLQKELRDVDKLLKFNPGNAEAIAQKQKLLGDQIANTSDKLKKLKDAQQQVKEQFDKNQISEEQYRNFRREIEYTETSLGKFTNSLAAVKAEQSKQGDSLKDLQRLFQLTGKDVSDFSDVLGTDLVRSIQNGKASSSDLDNAFRKIAASSLGAGKDIDKMKDALKQLDSGDSIKKVSREIDLIGDASDESKKSVNDLGSEIGGLAAGAAGVVGVGATIKKALDLKSLDTKIDITFDVDDSGKKEVRQAVSDIQAYGVDGEEALEGLRRQFALNSDASAKSNVEIVKGAAAITRAYSGVDITELVQEVNEIGSELKITDKEALNLVNDLLAIGFPPDQIDIIAEYGSQLKRAGFEAKEVKGILASAVATGSWNIDSLLDGLKEGRIRAAEMGAGISSGMKDSLRAALNTTKAASTEQLAVMRDNFDVQERNLEQSLSNRENALAKSYEQQKKAVSEAHEQEYESVAKSYEQQEKALEKRLESQYEATAKSYERQERGLEKTFTKQTDALEKKLESDYQRTAKYYEKVEADQVKVYEKQEQALEKKLTAEYERTAKSYEKQEQALEKSYDKQEQALEKKLEKEYEKTSKNYEKMESNLEKSLEREMSAFEKASDRRLKLIDKEYVEKMKLVDEEKYNKLKAIDDQIKTINDTSEAEAKALEKRENDQKLAELRLAIAQAKTAEQRADAQKELADFEEKLRIEKVKAEREATIENLKAEKDAINEEYDAKKEKLQTELEKKKEQAEKSIKAELEALEKVQKAKKEKLREDLDNRRKNIQEANKAELDAVKEVHEARKERLHDDLENRKQNAQESIKAEVEALKEINEAKKEKLREDLESKKASARESIKAELDALKEVQEAQKERFSEQKESALKSLQERNQGELEATREVASNRLGALKDQQDAEESALAERLDAQLNGARDANSAELEAFKKMNNQKLDLAKNPPDSQAFKDMEKQLETWGKAIAQGGEKGSKAFKEMVSWLNSIEDETTRNIIGTELFGTMWEDQGENLVKIFTGLDDAQKKLDENTKNLGDSVKKIDADPMVLLQKAVGDLFIALEPLLMVIAQIVGAIASFAIENPKLTSTIVAIGAGITALIGIAIGLAPIITAITGVMAALGVGFTVALGPIALIAAAVVGLIALAAAIVLNWEPITEFFSDLWTNISDLFTEYGTKLLDYVTENWKEILAGITGPIGLAVLAIVENWDTIKAKTVEIFDGIGKKIGTIIRFITDLFANLSLKFPSLNTEGFSNARERISGVIERIKKFFADLSLKFPSLNTEGFSNARERISGVIERIKAFFANLSLKFPSLNTEGFSNARERISGVIERIKSFFSGLSLKFPSLNTDIFTQARDSIFSILDSIKSFFNNLDLSFPSIKMPELPHFSLNGSFSLDPPSVPTLDIDWYKKGGVFGGASIIGVGEEPGVSEAVIPLKQSVLSKIGQGIAETMNGGAGDIIIKEMNVRNDNDIRLIAQQLDKLQRRDGRGKG